MPRRKKNLQKSWVGVHEPIRMSLLDYLESNFSASDRKSFYHRIIYVGDHKFSTEPGNRIEDFFNKAAKDVNFKLQNDKLGGILLFYPKYFAVMAEGNDDALSLHMAKLFPNKKKIDNLLNLKLVSVSHHINQILCPVWVSTTAIPPTLLQSIDANADRLQTRGVLMRCVKKMYELALDLKNQSLMTEEEIQTAEAIHHRYVNCLIEYETIDFLLNSMHVPYLTMYAMAADDVENYRSTDPTFPPSCSFAPVTILLPPIDPIEDIPMKIKVASFVYAEQIDA